MEWKKIARNILIIFLIVNSMFLIRFKVPGLAEPEVNISNDLSTNEFNQSYDNVRMVNGKTFMIRYDVNLEYNLTIDIYNQNNSLTNRLSLNSDVPIRILLIDEDGIFLADRINQVISQYSLDGKFIKSTELLGFGEFAPPSGTPYYPFIELVRDDTSYYIFHSWRQRNSDIDNTKFTQLIKWDLDSNELTDITYWTQEDTNTLYVDYVRQNNKLFVLEFDYTDEDNDQYMLQIHRLDNQLELTDEKMVSFSKDIDTMYPVSMDEIYTIEKNSGVTNTFVIQEIFSLSSVSYETNVSRIYDYHVARYETMLIVSGSGRENNLNPFLFSIDKRGFNLRIKSYDIGSYIDSQYFYSLSGVVIEENKLSILTTIFRSYSYFSVLYSFQNSLKSPILPTTIPHIIQFNLAGLIISSIVAMITVYSRKISNPDNLEYPLYSDNDE